MPVEQVNAWANYEQTAKTARHFSNFRRPSLQQADLRNRGGLRDISRHSYIGDLSLENVSSGFFETLSMESGKSARRLEIDDMENKKKMTANNILSEIRNVLPVFFEGSTIVRHEPKTSMLRSCVNFCNGTMPGVREYIKSKILLFFDMCLRGIGQVYLQNNPVSGLFILVALFIQSSRVAVYGVIAVVCGTSVALLLGFDKGLASSGLFGYNSFLVGLAIATFDSGEKNEGYKLSTILATIVFSSFTSILFVMLGKLLVPYTSPPLTLPFNFSTMLFLLAVANMGRDEFDSVLEPSLPDYRSYQVTGVTAGQFFAGTLRGIGQVYLANNLISGALVLAGIAVCSRICAVAAFLGSALGAATALATGVDGLAVAQGMFGFNASLSVTAMFMFYVPSTGAAILAAIAGIMTVLGQQGLATVLEPVGLPFMTLPFCVIALPFIIIQGTTSIVIAVPLASMTIPEDHLRRVRMLSDGFAFVKEVLIPENAPKLTRVHSRKVSKSLSRLGTALVEAEDLVSNKSPDKCKPTSRQSLCPTKFWIGRLNSDEVDDDALKLVAKSLFSTLDTKNTGSLPIDEVTDILQTAGLTDPEELHFAGLILNLMDLDESGTIEENEFLAFATVAQAVEGIRQKLAKFFDFVDTAGNRMVTVDELNSALDYLGQPVLEDDEMYSLINLTRSYDNENGFEVVELINLIMVAKVKVFVNAYHCTNEGEAISGYDHDTSESEVSA